MLIFLCFHIELPPLKRRRGLGGSIISTALNAALIGTAVGLTVYRLWRGHGKQQQPEPETEQLPPPPPYQRGGWVPVRAPSADINPAPRKSRPPMASTSSKRHVARRRPRARPSVAVASSPPSDAHLSKRRHFNSADDEDDDGGEGEVESQMDWIGDKLSMLIEEGKKALGQEVVVMSDVPEDGVDDGTGAWEEADEDAGGSGSGRAGSVSRRRSGSGSIRQRPLPMASTYIGSPRTPVPIPPARKRSLFDEGGGEEGQSPEMREYMEKARARYRNRQ